MGNKPSEKKDLIWRLINFYKTPAKQLLALVLFIGLFRLAFGSFSLAIITIASMYLHEMGHYYWFRRGKVKAVLLLLFPLGAVAAPASKAQNKKSDQLDWYHQAWLMQSGPAVNVALALLGTVLSHVGQAAWLIDLGYQILSVNAMLAALNLIPIWKLDASQLFNKLIFSSLDRAEDRFLSWTISAGTLLVIAAMIFFAPIGTWQYYLVRSIVNSPFVILLLISVAGIWHSQAVDDDSLSDSKLSMTNQQVVVQVLFYAFLVGALILALKI